MSIFNEDDQPHRQPGCLARGVMQSVSKPTPNQVEPQPAPSGDVDTTAWSPVAMVARLDGDVELAHQLIALFLGEYPKLMDNLRRSVSGGESDAIRRAAHAAKGCIANFVEGGGPQATAFRIEQLGTAGALSEVPCLVSQLERELEALARDMIAFQESSCES